MAYIKVLGRVLLEAKLLVEHGKHYSQFFESYFSVAESFLKVLEGHEKLPPLLPFRYEIHDEKEILQCAAILVPEIGGFIDCLEHLVPILKELTFEGEVLKRKYLHELLNVYNHISSITKWIGIEYHPPISEADLLDIWESDMIKFLSEDNDTKAILWVDEVFLEAQFNKMEEDAIILRSTLKNFKTNLERVQFLATPQNSGRIGFIMNIPEPDQALQLINSSPFGNINELNIMVNKEKITKPHIMDKIDNKSIRKDVLPGSLLGFQNFAKMSTLLWIGEKKVISEIAVGLQTSGVNLFTFDTLPPAVIFIAEHPHLRKNKNFRIFVALSDENKTDFDNFIKTVRLGQSSSVPILVWVSNLKNYDHSYNKYDFVRLTTDKTEVQTYGLMQPINWAKPELVIGKKKPFHFTGKMILTIHKMSCENLYPCDSNNKSDPFIIMYLADEKIQKTAVIKETIFPVFEHLEWVVEVGPTDSIKFEVYDWDRIGKSTFEGQIVFPNVTYLCEYPMQRKQQAFVLTATDPSNSKKASRIRGTITIEVSLEPKIETTPRHFKRPLKESLLQAEKDKILHVTQLCIYSIMKEHLQAEGIFRLPGSAPEVKALRDKVDNGEKVDLSSTFVHNVGSLFKSYFMELPTALLPEDLYDQFKKCYQEQEIDKKIEVTKALFSQIPECNRRVFIDLVNLLSSISKYSEINFMAPKNLAICFAPTVIIPKQLANDAQTALIESPSVTSHLAFIVENLDDIFPVVPDPFASLPAPKLEIPAEVVPEVPEQTEKVEKTPPPSINIEDSGSQLEDNLGSRKGSTSTPVELSQIRSSPSKEDLSIDEATEKIHSNRPSSEEDLLYQVRGKKSKSLGKPKGLIKKEVPLSARNEEGKEEGNLYSSPDKVMMKTTSMKRIPRKSTSGIKPFGKKKEDDVIETLEEEQSATAPALLHASSMSVIPTIPPPPPPPPKKRSNRFAPAPRSTSHTNFKPRLTADAGKVKRKKTMGKKDKKDRIDIQDAMEQLDKIMERLDEKDLKNFKEFMIQLAREED